MAQDVRLAKLGPSMKEGLIVAWLKGEGDRVTQGEPLFQVETDKAVTEVEAPVSGVLTRIVKPEGERVPVGEVVAIIESQETED